MQYGLSGPAALAATGTAPVRSPVKQHWGLAATVTHLCIRIFNVPPLATMNEYGTLQ
jgi:hypothetical protein